MADQERRWDDLEGRWVVLSQGRQGRPVLEAGAGLPCPFCPGPEGVSELPQGDYRVAVFENRYPPLGGRPAALPDVPWGEGQTAAPGRAEVVVYSPSHGASLGDLPEAHLADLIWVWADRTWEGLRDPGSVSRKVV
jgi:UDPglucose--hexose-1-phosphate uridylyltransferase